MTKTLNMSKIQDPSVVPATQTSSNESSNQIVFWNKTRILISLLSTLCLTLLIANSLALNFTVICMFEENVVVETTTSSVNETDFLPKNRPLYSDSQISWLFFAIPFGAILGSVPISYLTNKFGFRNTFTLYGLISAISTLLLPLATSAGFYFVIVARLFQGLGFATSFPACGAVVAEWGPIKRSGTYFAYLSTHFQLGSILTMPLAGELCESQLGWQSLYYFLGCTTILLFALFFYFFRDSPSVHRNVSQKELEMLQRGKTINAMKEGKRAKIPYREILTDKAILGILISGTGGALGFQLFFQYSPIYLNKILKFDVQNTGFATAFPNVLAMLTKFIAGPLSDSIPYLNDKQRLILFASLSQFTMAICCFGLAFIPADYPTLIQISFTGAIVFSALNGVGVMKSGQMISASFAYCVMAMLQFILSFVTLLLPLIVSIFCPDQTKEEWSRLFIFTGIVLAIVTMAFNCTAESAPRPWTYLNLSEPSKVAPLDVNTLKLDNICEKNLDDLIKQKRLSLESNNNNSIGVTIDDDIDKDSIKTDKTFKV